MAKSEWTMEAIMAKQLQVTGGAGKLIVTPSAPVKENKYRNKKIIVDGILWDSQKESHRYQELKLQQKTGQITELRWKEPFELVVNHQTICVYVSDFSYRRGTTRIVEDVKSKVTRKLPVYLLKKKLMAAVYNIEIVEI